MHIYIEAYLQFEQILAKAFNNLSFPFQVLPDNPDSKVLIKEFLAFGSKVLPNLLATVDTAFAAYNKNHF